MRLIRWQWGVALGWYEWGLWRSAVLGNGAVNQYSHLLLIARPSQGHANARFR